MNGASRERREKQKREFGKKGEERGRGPHAYLLNHGQDPGLRVVVAIGTNALEKSVSAENRWEERMIVGGVTR